MDPKQAVPQYILRIHGPKEQSPTLPLTGQGLTEVRLGGTGGMYPALLSKWQSHLRQLAGEDCRDLTDPSKIGNKVATDEMLVSLGCKFIH